MVRINGEQMNVDGTTISKFLQEAGYNMERIVVEKNMEIVPKANYDSTLLEDGDEVEVVSFVGGG